MKRIEDTFVWRGAEKGMSFIMIVASFALIAIVGATVFIRYCLSSDFFGSDELITLFAMWLYWVGAAYGSFEESHISADMSDLVIKSQKGRETLKFIVRLIVMLVTAVLAYWGVFEYGAWNISSGTTTSGLCMPLIWCTGIISVSYVLMFIFAIYHFVNSCIIMKHFYIDKKGGEA